MGGQTGFEATASSFLERLAKLRDKTLELIIVERMPSANHLLTDALNVGKSQILVYNRTVKASYKSTRELLFDICWLMPKETALSDDNEQDEIITGHIG